MSVPAWVQDAIFYQIFPDRFANGNSANDPANVQSWGEKPDRWGFQGGDLAGVIKRIDYLVDLGVNALYFNPIFKATSNHRYNTSDFYQIDPMLGSSEDFMTLLDEAHKRGMHVVLDGVFNHCGRGFFAFNDVVENEQHSQYRDWFHIKRFPLDAYSPGAAKNFLGWWKLKSLPKFNTSNPQLRAYIFDVARYWIEQGIDGWRLDVPNEIDDDGFWAEFRQVVKHANPQAYLLGEIWKADPRWVGPNHFDGLMNYPLRTTLIELLEEQSISAADFIKRVDMLLGAYPRENSFAHYVSLGTHDTPRLTTILQGDQRKLKLSYLILFSYAGAPAIYYGDEIGLEGQEDPDNRRAFPWDEREWNGELRRYICRLIELRSKHAELRRGDVLFLSCDSARVVAMARQGQDATTLLVFNPTDASMDVRLSVADLGWIESQVVEELLSNKKHVVSGGRVGLHLPPYGGILLRNRPGNL